MRETPNDGSALERFAYTLVALAVVGVLAMLVMFGWGLWLWLD